MLFCLLLGKIDYFVNELRTQATNPYHEFERQTSKLGND